MKKFVLNLDLQDDKEQQRRAFKTVSTLTGINEISIDLKGKKLTVIGTVDPVNVVSKLRKKNWPANIISVGPAKEPEKKQEPKKEEPKKEEAPKEEPKKEEPKKEEPKKEEPKKEEAKKEEPKKEEEKKAEPGILVPTAMPYRPYRPQYYPTMNAPPYYPQMNPPYYPQMNPPPYYPQMNTHYPVHHSVEENPNGCIIC